MKLLLLAAAGGAIGAGARYLVNIWAARSLGPALPWSTFIVNVVGCGLMGILYVALVLRHPEQEAARVFLATGILGGFTTFSAFALDFAHLVGRGDLTAAIVYAAGSVLVSLAAFAAGAALARWVIA